MRGFITPLPRSMVRFRSIVLLAIILTTPAGGVAAERSSDYSAISVGGLQIEIFSTLSPVAINQIHSWQIRITDDRKQIVANAQVSVTGGMPDHNHGLPTQPQVTSQLEGGFYVLEGVRFHMPGRWQIIVSIKLAGEEDRAIIDFQL